MMLKGNLFRAAEAGLKSAHLRQISISTRRMNTSNSEEIEKLNLLIKKKIQEIEESERRKAAESLKPKLSDFKRPILLTLLIGSTAYLTLHLAWWNLEYYQREEELKALLQAKEEELDEQLKLNGQTGSIEATGKRSIWSKLRFWRPA